MSLFRILLVVFLTSNLFSQSTGTKAPLGTKEIESSKRIEFINRSTRRANEDTKESNTALGKKLSESISSSKEGKGESNGISVSRILTKDGKLGADVLTISEGRDFDHINSIVRIISSYLENSFQYSTGNADTLAQYVLYYNASHRGDLSFFEKKYSPEVVSNLDKSKVGIDKVWKNWPGKTQIVIPIEKNILKPKGKDTAVDELERDVNKTVKEKEKNKEVKEKMQTEKVKMDNLQDKKIVEEKKQIVEKKQDLVKKEEKVVQKEQENKKQEEASKTTLKELNKDPVKNKDQIAKENLELQKIQDEGKKIQEEKKVVAEEKKEVAEKEKQVAAKEEQRKEDAKSDSASSSGNKSDSQTAKEDAKAAQEKADKLEKQLQEVKQELKKKEDTSENVIGDKIAFMKFIKYDTDGHYSNELWMIDPVKDDALFKSPYSNICSKEFVEVKGEGILVLGYDGESVADRKHKLVMLDKDSLKLKKVSQTNDIFWRTPMEFRDGKIFVFEKKDGKYYLSRFKPNLDPDGMSSEPIDENSSITFIPDKIYINAKAKDSDKTIIKVFKRDDLSILKTITK